MGPVNTYMASCGDTTCDKFDSTQAVSIILQTNTHSTDFAVQKWFKIDEQGLKKDGTWIQADMSKLLCSFVHSSSSNGIVVVSGTPSKTTLPSNIAPGGYLLRHEIIALHLADSVGGAEFYASCSQINVSGSGTGKPTDSELVSLPGAYTDKDPGIFVPTVRALPRFALLPILIACLDLQRDHGGEIPVPWAAYCCICVWRRWWGFFVFFPFFIIKAKLNRFILGCNSLFYRQD